MNDKNKIIILNGVDIVCNKRIKKLIERSPFALNDIFSQNEINYCNQKKYPYQSYAVRFAAKESIIKATDSNILQYELNKIEVLNTKSGKPYFNINCNILKNKIYDLINKKSYEISLTLSHEKEYSIAQVIIY